MSRRCVRCGARDVPRAPLPALGVTHRRVVPSPPQRALPLLPRSYGLMRPTNLLARLSVPLYRASLQVAASPCWTMVVPDVISACLSLDAWTLTPAAWWVHVPITSPPPSAFPQSLMGRLPASIRSATSEREVMSELQSFTHVQASRVAATQVAPTAVPYSTGQPWRLRPSSTPVVTFRCIGYASRPNGQLTAGGLPPP